MKERELTYLLQDLLEMRWTGPLLACRHFARKLARTYSGESQVFPLTGYRIGRTLLLIQSGRPEPPGDIWLLDGSGQAYFRLEGSAQPSLEPTVSTRQST